MAFLEYLHPDNEWQHCPNTTPHAKPTPQNSQVLEGWPLYNGYLLRSQRWQERGAPVLQTCPMPNRPTRYLKPALSTRMEPVTRPSRPRARRHAHLWPNERSKHSRVYPPPRLSEVELHIPTSLNQNRTDHHRDQLAARLAQVQVGDLRARTQLRQGYRLVGPTPALGRVKICQIHSSHSHRPWAVVLFVVEHSAA